MPTLVEQLKSRLSRAVLPGRLYLGEREMQVVISELDRLTAELAAVAPLIVAAGNLDRAGFMPIVEAAQSLPAELVEKYRNPVKPRRTACYHARDGFPGRVSPRFGQRVTVVTQARQGVHPRNVLIQFCDGQRSVTSIGCLRWKCDQHAGHWSTTYIG